jgi:hypothetical protein
MLVKFSLMHSHRRLFPCPTKNELSSGFVHAVGKILQCLQARGIDGCHIAEPKNNNRRQIGQAIYDHIDFVGCAKQEGAVDSEDADALAVSPPNFPGSWFRTFGSVVVSSRGDSIFGRAMNSIGQPSVLSPTEVCPDHSLQKGMLRLRAHLLSRLAHDWPKPHLQSDSFPIAQGPKQRRVLDASLAGLSAWPPRARFQVLRRQRQARARNPRNFSMQS